MSFYDFTKKYKTYAFLKDGLLIKWVFHKHFCKKFELKDETRNMNKEQKKYHLKDKRK